MKECEIRAVGLDGEDRAKVVLSALGSHPVVLVAGGYQAAVFRKRSVIRFTGKTVSDREISLGPDREYCQKTDCQKRQKDQCLPHSLHNKFPPV